MKDLSLLAPGSAANSAPRPVEPSAAAALEREPACLSDRQFRAARILWLVVLALSVGFFILSLPTKLSTLQTVCPAPGCGLSSQDAESLAALGVSLPAYAWLRLSLQVLHTAVYFAVALVLFRWSSNRRLELLLSLALLAYGTTAYASISHLPRLWPDLLPPVEFLTGLGLITLLSVMFFFPDGHYVPRWGRYANLLWVLWAVPWYIPPRYIFNLGPWTNSVWFLTLFAWFGLALYTQLFRYRSASTVVLQQQTKWVVYGMTVAILGFVTASAPWALALQVPSGSPQGMAYNLVRTVIGYLSSLAVPVTIGIAMLRYRLWGIDLLINRTLVYVPLTAVVAGLFSALILFTQRLFVAWTGQQSDLAVVLTTLVVVAAYTPIRTFIQGQVDRHFKEVIDPAKRLEAFVTKVNNRMASIDDDQALLRLLEEAVASFKAAGGEAYLQRQDRMVLLKKIGAASDPACMNIAVSSNGRTFGSISLGPRRDGQAYSPRDCEALGRAAAAIAQAIEEDRLQE